MINTEEILKKRKNTLPDEVSKNLDNLEVIGSSGKVVKVPDGRKYHLDNKLNDLSGSEWTYFTNSVINTNYSTTGTQNYAYKVRKIHPSPKPPQLLAEIIKFFTKKNDVVFDYFSGVGGTLLACSLTNRVGVGIELNPEYVRAYTNASNELGLNVQKVITGDSLVLIDKEEVRSIFDEKKAKLILIDPPYYNMMSREKTGDDISRYGSNGTPFTDSEHDFGNMSELDFWSKLVSLVEKSLNYLDDKGHVVVFIKDLQPKGKQPNMLHADMVNHLNSIPELSYIGMKIWADQTAKLYPYGYPFAFVATQIHQYILMFKKTAK